VCGVDVDAVMKWFDAVAAATAAGDDGDDDDAGCGEVMRCQVHMTKDRRKSLLLNTDRNFEYAKTQHLPTSVLISSSLSQPS